MDITLEITTYNDCYPMISNQKRHNRVLQKDKLKFHHEASKIKRNNLFFIP